jgi:hypothetical protein
MRLCPPSVQIGGRFHYSHSGVMDLPRGCQRYNKEVQLPLASVCSSTPGRGWVRTPLVCHCRQGQVSAEHRPALSAQEYSQYGNMYSDIASSQLTTTPLVCLCDRCHFPAHRLWPIKLLRVADGLVRNVTHRRSASRTHPAVGSGESVRG